MTDKQWFTNRYPKATGAEIEAFEEKVAQLWADGWSVNIARVKASGNKSNNR